MKIADAANGRTQGTKLPPAAPPEEGTAGANKEATQGISLHFKLGRERSAEKDLKDLPLLPEISCFFEEETKGREEEEGLASEKL